MSQSIPKPIQDVIQAFSRLPGIGPKTASRLSMHLLQSPKHVSEELVRSIHELKQSMLLCKDCWHLSTTEACGICTDDYREKSVVCVVEEPADLIALEKTGNYKGLYHVLHGVLSPIEGIGPDDIRLKELLDRVNAAREQRSISEVILATNPTMEGEATANYLAKLLKPMEVRVTRIARGLPSGGDIEYADDLTLTRSLEGRIEF